MTKAIRIHESGGPEVLRYEDVEVGDPGPGELRIRQSACGLNYIDTYQRNGLYPLSLPATLGIGFFAAVFTGTAVFLSHAVRWPRFASCWRASGVIGSFASA